MTSESIYFLRIFVILNCVFFNWYLFLFFFRGWNWWTRRCWRGSRSRTLSRSGLLIHKKGRDHVSHPPPLLPLVCCTSLSLPPLRYIFIEQCQIRVFVISLKFSVNILMYINLNDTFYSENAQCRFQKIRQICVYWCCRCWWCRSPGTSQTWPLEPPAGQ